MRGTLKSGARKVQRTGLIDERSMNGEMRIWTRIGRIVNKGGKSEVQGDLQIPSSLVALAPLFLSLSHPCSGVFTAFSPFFRECVGKIYGVYMYVHIICAYVFLRGVIARNKKDDLRLFLHRESWSSPSALCVQIASHSDKSAFDTLLPVEDNFLFIPKMRCRKATIRASSSETRNCPWYKRHDLISLADIEMTILNYGPDFWQDVDRITRFNSTKWTWN